MKARNMFLSDKGKGGRDHLASHELGVRQDGEEGACVWEGMVGGRKETWQ